MDVRYQASNASTLENNLSYVDAISARLRPRRLSVRLNGL